MTPRISLLVPAHNEAAVIAGTLAPLRPLAQTGEIEILVLPNACTDDTAGVARRTCPEARVIEIAAPGKTHALNIGTAAARGEAIVCLDADLVLEAEALRALAAPLLAGRADATCGRMQVDLTSASALVRAFYKGWFLSPYHDHGKFGGVYALSAAAVAEIFPLPPVTADDEYISRQVPEARVAYCPDVTFTVFAPRRLSALLAIRKRAYRGTRALGGHARGRASDGGAARTVLARALRRPGHWLPVAVYFAVVLAARAAVHLEPSRNARRWERDETSRTGRRRSVRSAP